MSTHATQTSPSIPNSQNGQNGHASPQTARTSQQGPPRQNAPHPAPKKNRRATAKEYLNAARQRRDEQIRKNERNPVSKEDQWTCEFCEYEQIFGEPPMALIRQYEIKARATRKKDEERQRLLAKVKTKGRKGKKGSKPAQKTAPPPPDRQPQQSQHHAPTDYHQDQEGTQSEEYYDDQEEYDEEGSQDDPPPSPSGARAARRTDPHNTKTPTQGEPSPGIPVS